MCTFLEAEEINMYTSRCVTVPGVQLHKSSEIKTKNRSTSIVDVVNYRKAHTICSTIFDKNWLFKVRTKTNAFVRLILSLLFADILRKYKRCYTSKDFFMLL